MRAYVIGVTMFRLILRSTWALFWVVAASVGVVEPAQAARKAFVVGNSAYSAAPPLPNSANDARDLAARLTGLGYQVTTGVDLTRVEFLRRFQAFAQSLSQEDVALLFYAGHALQVGGENYLFPIDARVEKEADARTNLVPLNALLADLSRSTRNRLVILDACRNNPFEDALANAQATRSAGGASRGLARVYAGVGSFIAYSTQPGNVALDGTGRNSPFTTALLKHITEPGLDVHAVMRRVRGDVQRVTAEQQVPWENSSLVDEVAFSGAVVSPTVAPVAASGAGTSKMVSVEAKRMPTAPAEQFSYVSGLDPKGDNFLTLRAGTGADAARIATMGPDTPLKVVGSSGAWKNVVLRDGTRGWAHG
ncbi:MAG: caspase family protein, partial [Hyphomicrobiaceae bacterium]